jgi:tetratricopeptide (TPR) repeat protein
MNRLADAETHIMAALKDDPNLPEAHDVLGGLLENRGRLDDALAEYREAVRIRPNFGKAHLDLGAALAKSPRQGGRGGRISKGNRGSESRNPATGQTGAPIDAPLKSEISYYVL